MTQEDAIGKLAAEIWKALWKDEPWGVLQEEEDGG